MLPRTSKKLRHDEPAGHGASYSYAIAEALRAEMGRSRRSIKTLSRWTGASDRTVQNWLSAVRGPSGPHLIELARRSDAVHEAFLSLVGRLEDARPRIEMSAALIQQGLDLLTRRG
ncbi:hypothetical protein [Burkholderia gladioli]|uniref:hypothetical protein n=1 Tax=Burkholderia gladioli TaxID=28095 RepID=UPI000CFF85D5|nr:hypothetical protein [Burkholderia gladioli]MBU9276930.1 hypothetical protein [Burkholderia gladioli]PRE26144.1 hypothetical protein C6P72_09890 [Burkholderia gladioli]